MGRRVGWGFAEVIFGVLVTVAGSFSNCAGVHWRARWREEWADFPRACDGGLDLNIADMFNGDSDQAIGFGL